jgi:peptide deformylase
LKATVKAYDEEGIRFERGASGLLAQVFQHECDHLDGILYVDKAEEVMENPKEEPDEK